MTGPTVSVVMPVRDPDPRHLRAAVASVLGQELADLELLLVEDADAPVVLDGVADPRLRRVVNQEPGMAAARNEGLRQARAELVAMCDADDVCEPERLRLQVERMAAEPGLAVLGTFLTIVDGEGRVTASRRYPVDHDAILAALPRVNPIAHPSVLLRRRAVLDAGGYRARTCEDYDLWSRLALAGARFANLDRPLVRYRIHAGATKARRLRASLRDTIRIKREHWRGKQGLRGVLRLCGERALLLLPGPLVLALFQRLELQRGAG